MVSTRGFAVEMTLQRGASDRTWTRLFGIGSFVAAFAQGVLFGGLLCGVTVRHGVFAGGTWDFFGHGYAVLTGLLNVTLFSLAGAARLQAKTDGALRGQMVAIVRPLTLATVAGVAVSAALLPVATSAQLHLGGVDRWLPFGYAVLVAAAGFWTAYRRAGRIPDRPISLRCDASPRPTTSARRRSPPRRSWRRSAAAQPLMPGPGRPWLPGPEPPAARRHPRPVPRRTSHCRASRSASRAARDPRSAMSASSCR